MRRGDEDGEIEFDNIVVRLPGDPGGRRKIYKLLCEHQCERVEACEDPMANHEDPDRYFGERYCLLRFDALDSDA